MKFANIILLSLVGSFFLTACQEQPAKNNDSKTEIMKSIPKFSLAQWSFNRELFAGKMKTTDFIKVAGEMGFDGVEYVSQFFQDKVEDFKFLDSLNVAAKEAGVLNLLIMLDDSIDLGASNKIIRDQAVENGQKWIRAAKYLGCKSIRVNARGDGDAGEVKAACIDAIGRLAAFGQKEGIDILIENHGNESNNGAWLLSVLEALKPFGVGSLPDLDNWCTAREDGALWDAPCIEKYNRFTGMKEIMPYAKAVSVKSFDFDKNGGETTIDYAKMFEIIQAANYDGYLGIEFEGDGMDTKEGIEKTRALVKKVWK